MLLSFDWKTIKDVSAYHNSEVTELIFMFRTDDTKTNMYEIPSVLCWFLSFLIGTIVWFFSSSFMKAKLHWWEKNCHFCLNGRTWFARSWIYWDQNWAIGWKCFGFCCNMGGGGGEVAVTLFLKYSGTSFSWPSILCRGDAIRPEKCLFLIKKDSVQVLLRYKLLKNIFLTLMPWGWCWQPAKEHLEVGLMPSPKPQY